MNNQRFFQNHTGKSCGGAPSNTIMQTLVVLFNPKMAGGMGGGGQFDSPLWFFENCIF